MSGFQPLSQLKLIRVGRHRQPWEFAFKSACSLTFVLHPKKGKTTMSLDHHIEPIRMSAVLRRKAILQQYCSIEKPTAADAKRFADAMGLGLSRFTQMAKAWRTLPDVTTIQGATVKADRKPKLSKAVVDLLEATIARMGASTPATSIEREFRWACADRDLDPPSSAAIHYRIMKARAKTSEEVHENGLALFQCRFQVPVDTPAGIQSPWITAAIKLPTKEIICPQIGIGMPSDFKTCLDALSAEGNDLSVQSVFIPTRKLRALSKKTSLALLAAKKARSGPVLIGSRIGGINVFHRPYPNADDKLARRLWGRLNSPLSPEEAQAVILHAIATHNADMQSRFKG
ncbi:hypothetical protein [Sphingomonas sp. CCH19-C6]|uniref:hypothetical protein n=2 Tax=Sphingomonas TaxID=13687 RepID=UPI0012E3334B|nr:hypothetical protein [Sphingomonas sp. CCH19-C6]